jgi:hypothetical protein
MKYLLLLLVSFNALAIECVPTSEKKFNAIREELVAEGKGILEINDIMRARIKICQGKCPPAMSTFDGLCMAKVNKGNN